MADDSVKPLLHTVAEVSALMRCPERCLQMQLRAGRFPRRKAQKAASAWADQLTECSRRAVGRDSTSGDLAESATIDLYPRIIPDGTVEWRSPSGKVYTTKPGGVLFFPALATPTGEIVVAQGPNHHQNPSVG